ncbi:MAG: carboxypeptidase regulatory-like domain-containing protein [Verrucomicrobia bacterium]|nr:carboxypeptidase regulatory-like domain-containing protein [Verrucomicrobiota bacterium]
MNALWETLASDSWSHVIQALLHTLWIGGVATLGLFVVLRRAVRPEVRYRWCVAAMTFVFLGGLIAWGVLQEQASREVAVYSEVSHETYMSHVTHVSHGNEQKAPAAVTTQPLPSTSSVPWTPWLALVWLVGLALMLARSAVCVASAESIRSSGRPVEDPAILRLLEETRLRLGLIRRIRVVMTETLSTPAVMGIIVPTLILPLSLVTSMSLQQLQFVFLHELAHVRRGDYLANLCQLLIESILFFNPAIWWISRQMRHEREACCDAIAIELTGGHIEYAETLAHVAASMLAVTPRGVPAFGERKSSSLMDRVQRILVPGYRPGMSLTWKALFGSLFIGGLLLLLSAVGTRLTVSVAAKLLTPAERIVQIEQKMVERGARLEVEPDEQDQIEVRGTIRTEDGSPVPGRVDASFFVNRDRSSASHSVQDNGKGVYTGKVSRGDLYFSASHVDFAPAFVGPIDIRKTTEVPELNLVFKRGFAVSFRVSDAQSGEPISGTLLKCQFWFPINPGTTSFPSKHLTTDSQGIAVLNHCDNYPLSVKVEKAGYEYEAFKFDSLEPSGLYEIRAQKVEPVRGVVVDATTGAPVPKASLHVFRGEGPRAIRSIPGGQTHQYQRGDVYGFSSVNPWNPGAPLTTTDEQGRFILSSLPAAGRYSLLVDAPGYTQAILDDVRAGQANLRAMLAPEVVLKGTITGELSKLNSNWKGLTILARIEYSEKSGERGASYGENLPVQIENGVGHFTFTNKFGSAVTLDVAGQRFDPPAIVNGEWNIEISDKNLLKRREVVLRFVHPSGVPPKGTIYVMVPDKNSNALMRKEVKIENGEARVSAMVGLFQYEPARTVGYWFKVEALQVPEGNDLLVINVPVIPAGAIYATALNPDGSPANRVSYSLIETKKSPSLVESHWERVEMHDGIASPLPLGGTYKMRSSRDNSVCLSEPITLTEKAPDREVQLQFTPGRDIVGQLLTPDGRPIPNSTVKIDWHHNNSGFGHQAVATDGQGRFRFDNASPGAGEYRLTFHHPGMKTMVVPVNFSKLPLSVKMEPGLRLSGKVVEKKSGLPIPDAPVQTYSSLAPSERTKTDANGNFHFDTLHETSYRIHVEGANYTMNGAGEYKPADEKPVILEMVLPEWSRLKVAKP